MAPPDDDAYARGHKQGGVEEQIAEHGRRLDKINGTIADFARAMDELRLANQQEMQRQTLAIQRLADQAVARDATVVTTAAALKDADDARRAKDEQTWTPFARLIAVLGGLVAVATLIAYLALVRK